MMEKLDGTQANSAPTCSPVGGPQGRQGDFVYYLVLLATAGLLLGLIPLILHRFFDPDEFEHAHAAWCVSQGMLPYKDFFEHHTPWYYYALRPFFHWFDVAARFESARHFLLFGRGLSLALSALSVLLVSQIGRVWENRRVGVLAGLFLVSQPVFFQKSIEMRPDVLALPLFLGCLWFLLRELARSSNFAKKGLRNLLGGGLCLGAAVMCTQKMLFVLPGALSGLAIWSLFSGTAKAGARQGLLAVPTFLFGICAPVGLTWTAFAFHRAGVAFITNNFLLNASWKPIETGQLRALIDNSWPILSLGLLGGAVSLVRFFRRGRRRFEGLLLLCILAGLFGGVLILPSAHAQYYLIPLPLVCLLAAQGLLFLVERAQKRTRAVLLVLALIPLGILPALTLRESFGMRDEVQLARLRFVFDHTRPGDVVMDGWQGTGVFRPHAFRYFFLHPETVAMLPPSELEVYLKALERGEVRPKLIALDRNLVALGSRFLRFVKVRYISSDGFFFFRSGLWLPQQSGPFRRYGTFEVDRR